MVFDQGEVDYGLGDTRPSGGIAADDETWKASTLHSSLIAASCKRTFVPRPAMRRRRAFCSLVARRSRPGSKTHVLFSLRPNCSAVVRTGAGQANLARSPRLGATPAIRPRNL
jgi:hypothetical protein